MFFRTSILEKYTSCSTGVQRISTLKIVTFDEQLHTTHKVYGKGVKQVASTSFAIIPLKHVLPEISKRNKQPIEDNRWYTKSERTVPEINPLYQSACLPDSNIIKSFSDSILFYWFSCCRKMIICWHLRHLNYYFFIVAIVRRQVS